MASAIDLPKLLRKDDCDELDFDRTNGSAVARIRTGDPRSASNRERCATDNFRSAVETDRGGSSPMDVDAADIVSSFA